MQCLCKACHDGAKQREEAFDFVWRTIERRYYDPSFNGMDWKAAGERYRPLAMKALDDQAFQRVLAVNTVGPFQMVRACVPSLKAARGCIVNVSSVAGSLGIGSSMPYIASKGAVNSMTLHLARELAPEIRVNAVCPGWVMTPMAESFAADPARLLRQMDADGVERVGLINYVSPDVMGFTNEVNEWMTRYASADASAESR